AIQKALKRAGWGVAEVDLFEVNEAFAVVAMIAERDLGLDRAKLNVNGGACALAHPIGASGARIRATLLPALEARGGKKGVASLCIGGGEATAMAVELGLPRGSALTPPLARRSAGCLLRALRLHPLGHLHGLGAHLGHLRGRRTLA